VLASERARGGSFTGDARGVESAARGRGAGVRRGAAGNRGTQRATTRYGIDSSPGQALAERVGFVRRAPLEASDAVASVRPEADADRFGPARGFRAATLGCLLVGPPLVAQAAPFLWDEDGDRLDDRIETVHLLGYSYALDPLGRLRIGVVPVGSDL